MTRKILITAFAFFSFCFPNLVWATLANQEGSSQESIIEEQERENQLRQQAEEPSSNAETNAEEVTAPQQPAVVNNGKTLINNIVVSGNTLLAEEQLDNIIAPYEGKKLALIDMQKIADLITDAYRQKGYITTRAIIPPQKVENNTLKINIVLGTMGKLEVKGNRYFKKSLFTNKVTLKQGQPFNFNTLRSNLYNINQYPDRNVKTVLTPGENPGETDVLFNVKDHLPFHVGFSYDDFGPKDLGKSRFLGTATDNNLLGFDDILTFQYQESQDYAYKLEDLRYLFPVTSSTQIGVYSTRNQDALQGELKVFNARGKSNIYGGYVNQVLINQPNLKFLVDLGFDYKDIYNFIGGDLSSRDLERVAKTGFNLDYKDPFYGRNIINDELDVGIPDIMGGSKSVDDLSSINGAGGRFTKDVIDYLRLQSLPYDTSLLLKGEAQFASRTLDATEQYQLGGISNVRGFAPGEAVGDNGQTFTSEFSIPLYGLPHDIKIPFSAGNWYDSLRLAAFYDWGHVAYRVPTEDEFKARILDDYGCGLRLSLPEDFYIRLDFAWALTGQPSDGHSEHTWLQVSKQF